MLVSMARAEGDGASQSIPSSLLVQCVTELCTYWLLKSRACQCDTNTFRQSESESTKAFHVKDI